MSCHEAREWLSDVVDDALGAEARAQIDAHLAGCADCRRELDRLTATVSLLRAVARAQAPAGFADRVLDAACPTPWYRRLLDRLAAVRLLRFPVEAAAMVLVASLAVYVFQETPALRRAARPETSADHAADNAVSTRARPTAPDAAPETDPEHAKDSAQVLLKSRRLPPPAPRTSPPATPESRQPMMKAPTAEAPAAGANSSLLSGDSASREPLASPPAAPSVPQGAPPSPGVAVSQGDPTGRAEEMHRYHQSDDAPAAGAAAQRPTSQSSPVPLGGPVPPPETADRGAREKAQERIERAPPVPMPTSPPPPASTMRIVASAHVVGRLTVKDRQAADRELAELLSRVGGTETARRAEAGGEAVGVVVPRAAYPAFAQGLARIGSWLPETAPAELPDRVPITLRIRQ